MTPAYKVDQLVPHTGSMSLLDRVTGYGDGWLEAEIDIRSGSMFADECGVPAWVGLEYMAQTIAAYAGLQDRLEGSQPKIGFLLGSRKYTANSPSFVTGQTLKVRVEIEVDAGNGLRAFKCELRGDEVFARATVNVFKPDDAEKFLEGTEW